MKKYIKYLLLIFIGLFISSNFVSAEEEKKCSCRSGTYSYDLYFCVGDCPGKIKKQSWTGCWSSCCDGDPCRNYPRLNSEAIVATGEPWQSCKSGTYRVCNKRCSTSPDSYKPYFVCDGKCLPNVTDVRYYNNPNFPSNPELTISDPDKYSPEPSDNSSDNVRLPLKIDWDEDPYWQKTGNCGYFSCPDNLNVDSNGSHSYILKLELNSNIISPPTKASSGTFSDYISKDFSKDEEEIKQGYFEKLLNLDNQPSYIAGGNYRSSEYNFRVDHNPCWLKSGETYNLTIQTCCNADGTECNDGGSFNFTTSYAPELKSPEDLDWSGPNYSAWDAWKNLEEDDYEIDVEGRVLSLPDEKYNPFDWEKNPIKNYNGQKMKFPILLDWCDVEDVNGKKKTDKGMWLMKLFQFVPNEKGAEEDVPHPGTVNGIIAIPSKPVGTGFNWTDLLVSNYYDEGNVTFFTENEKYSWEIQSCLTDQGSCKGFGEHWSFETEDTSLSTNFYIFNNDGDILGIPTEIRWVLNKRVNSAKYEVPGITSGETKEGGVILEGLNLDTNYSIKVIPCSDYDSKKCEPENAKTLKFKTTGAPPKINAFDKELYIPFDISWQSVPQAMSYYYNLNGVETLVQGTRKTLSYPEVKSNTDYSLKVKTCADKEGKNCGEYSPVVTFKTEQIKSISSISTEKTNGILYTKDRQISFDAVKGANYYKYALKYIGDENMKEEEMSKTCRDLKDKGVMESISSNTSFYIESLCPDKYNISITPCLDSSCTDRGDINSFSFKLETLKAPQGHENHVGGLVPCNREYDDPTTPWDETLACNTGHIFLITRILFDFLLGRLLPAILVVLLLYNGALYLLHIFINFENPAMNLLQKSKDIWKGVGIGFLIILLSWTVINFFLLFFDPQMSVFGSWWDPLNK